MCGEGSGLAWGGVGGQYAGGPAGGEGEEVHSLEGEVAGGGGGGEGVWPDTWGGGCWLEQVY